MERNDLVSHNLNYNHLVSRMHDLCYRITNYTDVYVQKDGFENWLEGQQHELTELDIEIRLWQEKVSCMVKEAQEKIAQYQ